MSGESAKSPDDQAGPWRPGRLARVRELAGEGRGERASSGMGVGEAMIGLAFLALMFGLVRLYLTGDPPGLARTFVVGYAAGLATMAYGVRRDRDALRAVLVLAGGFALLVATFYLLVWAWEPWGGSAGKP